jgi:hypothetical protein
MSFSRAATLLRTGKTTFLGEEFGEIKRLFVCSLDSI